MLTRASSQRLEEITQVPVDQGFLTEGRILALPFPCLSWIGSQLLREFLPERLDPRDILFNIHENIEAYFESCAVLPDSVISLRGGKMVAIELLDPLSKEACNLISAVDHFCETFRFEKDGKTYETIAKSDAQKKFKSDLRVKVQTAFIKYQQRQLMYLKSLLRNDLYKSPHAGCFAPAIADPSLSTHQVRVPASIWPICKRSDVLVFRHPVLKVVYRLAPIPGSGYTIGIHPHLAKELGLDHDGDSLFVSPIPHEYKGEYYSVETPDEAMKLLSHGFTTNEPAEVPPLSLAGLGHRGSFMDWIKDQGVKNYDNPVISPFSNEDFAEAADMAAGRFAWEKFAIGPVDRVRRSLEVLLSEHGEEVLKAICKFCSECTQTAIDAGKHKKKFEINRYQLAFRGKYLTTDERNGRVRAANFDHPSEMAEELVSITGLSHLYEHAFTIACALFSFADFTELGLNGLLEKFWPFYALSIVNRGNTIDLQELSPEARCLCSIEHALPGLANIVV